MSFGQEESSVLWTSRLVIPHTLIRKVWCCGSHPMRIGLWVTKTWPIPTDSFILSLFPQIRTVGERIRICEWWTSSWINLFLWLIANVRKRLRNWHASNDFLFLKRREIDSTASVSKCCGIQFSLFILWYGRCLTNSLSHAHRLPEIETFLSDS